MIRQRHLRGFEALEGRCLLAADLIISEFSASNDNAIDDGFGDSSDWIEIYNRGDAGIDMAGFRLTDNLANLSKWQFPSVYLDAGEFLVVFASGADTTDPAGYLHTNFALSADGESVALVSPAGTIVSFFNFPAVGRDESYGIAFDSHSQQVISPHSPARYLVPQNGNVDSVWMNPEFDDSAWSAGTASLGYEVTPNRYAGQYQTAIPPGATSVYVRIPFVLDEADLLLANLSLKYDDGFIAYLNGVEIARDNAPDNAAYDDIATDWRVREAAVQDVKLDVVGHSDRLIQGENLLAIHLLNKGPDTDLLLAPHLTVTGGYPLTPTDSGPLAYATPGLPNSVTQAGEVSFSRVGGVFAEPFHLTLTPTQPGDTIRYTTDGTVPGPHSPLYEGPLHLASSTQIRARAYGPHGRVGNVRSEAYTLTLANHVEFTSDLPIVVLENYGKGIPGRAWQDAYFSLYDVDPVTGLSDLTGEPDVTTRSGQHRRGATSYNWSKFPLRIELRDEGGEDQDIGLLGMPAESDWILYGPYGTDRSLIRNSLWYDLAAQVGRYAVKTRYVEMFSNHDGGPLDANDYMGVYVLMETIKIGPDRLDIDKVDLNAPNPSANLGGYVFKVDRDVADEDATWNTKQGTPHNTPVFVHVAPERWEMSTAQTNHLRDHLDKFESALHGFYFRDPVRGYAPYINVDSFVDHFLLRTFSKEKDGLALSEHYFIDRDGKINMGPVWDFDLSSGYADDPTRGPEGWSWRSPDQPWKGGWFYGLFRDPAFIQQVIDRWQELRTTIFSDENLTTTVDQHAALITEAQTRNYDRWPESLNTGGILADPGLTGWEAAISNLKNWLLLRAEWIDQQFATPPVMTFEEGANPGEIVVTLESPKPGVPIYYTLDGSELFDSNWNVAPGVQLYTGPFTVTAGTLLNARARDTTTHWPYSSSVGGLVAITTPANSANLRLTELHYHPVGPTSAELAALPGVVDNEFEFLELTNVSSHWISLEGLTFTSGIEYSFASSDTTLLAPGTSIVLVSNRQAFEVRYGANLPVAGEYEGQLGNSDDQITLVDATGTTLFHISYLDRSPWPSTPDGDGPSLEILDPRFDPNIPQNWRASRASHGSPGVATRWGDFDGNGTVDTTDYQLWKSSYGQVVDPYTGADGNGDGVINTLDFVVWRNTLGDMSPAAFTAGIEAVGGASIQLAALHVTPQTSMSFHPERKMPHARSGAHADASNSTGEAAGERERMLLVRETPAAGEQARGEWRPSRRETVRLAATRVLDALFERELDWGVWDGEEL